VTRFIFCVTVMLSYYPLTFLYMFHHIYSYILIPLFILVFYYPNTCLFMNFPKPTYLQPLFQFLKLYTVGRTSMPWVEFESTIPLFEWAKTVHALDRTASLIAVFLNLLSKIKYQPLLFNPQFWFNSIWHSGSKYTTLIPLSVAFTVCE
jgi:hypothetical protein